MRKIYVDQIFSMEKCGIYAALNFWFRVFGEKFKD
jgi:hypothetical protein